MRKNFFYTAALLLAGAVMAACSGSDDITSDITPEPQPSAEVGTVELSGTLGSKGSTTRAVDADGNGTWEVGDKFAVYYQTANGNASTVATVNSVNNDGSANFTAVLHSPKAGDNSVKLVSPASAHDGQGGFKTDDLMNQRGTLEYINQKGLDIETASTTMNVEGMTAKLKADVTMQPQVCLYTLNLQCGDYYYEEYLATKLEISDGTHNYTIIPASATKSFTIAMLPVTAKFTFKATTTNERSFFTKLDVVTLDNCTADNVGDVFDKDGNIYKVSTGPGATYTRSYNSDKTLYAGKFYTSTFRLYADPITSPGVAMIAYVGGNGSVETNTSYRGLAIAMGECTQYNTTWPTSQPIPNHANYCTQETATCTNENNTDVVVACGWKDGITMTNNLVNHTSHTHWAAKAARDYNKARPSGTSEWFLPSLGQWQLIIQGLITKVDNEPYSVAISTTNNDKMKASHIGSVLIKAGAGASSQNPAGLENCYWSSSEYDAGKDWIVDFNYGRAGTQEKVTSFSTHVRPVLAF